jgi:acetyl esterase/lipase
MSYDVLQPDDRRDPKWGLPGDVRDNWNNPTIATFFADIMTPGLSQDEIDMGRAMFEGAFESMLSGLTLAPELEAAGHWEELWAPGCVDEPDAPLVRLHVRVPNTDTKNRPCVIYFFAAGMGGKPDYFDTEIAQISAALDAVVVAPQYRVHPENKEPAQLNDSEAAYNYAIDHAEELGIDPDNVVCTGYSIGGMASIQLALRLKRRGITLRGMSVVAPPVDDRGLGLAARITYASENLGCEEKVITWHSLFGIDKHAHPALPPEMVPNHATAEELKGMPPVFMHIMESDPNRDEDLMFCQKLLDANVMCGIHLWPGTNHATFYSGPSYPLKDAFYAEIVNDLRTLTTYDCRRPWLED